MKKLEEVKRIKPKQYSHINYEALLIYAMQKGVSIETAIEQNGLTIARSTVIRNVKKLIDESNGENEIVNLYKNEYVPNIQKSKLPEKIRIKIISLQPKSVVIEDELQELYNKLSKMKTIVEQCNGNYAEAARQINSGNTILGDVHISRQGLGKNLARYKMVKEAIESRTKSEEIERK